MWSHSKDRCWERLRSKMCGTRESFAPRTLCKTEYHEGQVSRALANTYQVRSRRWQVVQLGQAAKQDHRRLHSKNGCSHRSRKRNHFAAWETTAELVVADVDKADAHGRTLRGEAEQSDARKAAERVRTNKQTNMNNFWWEARSLELHQQKGLKKKSHQVREVLVARRQEPGSGAATFTSQCKYMAEASRLEQLRQQKAIDGSKSLAIRRLANQQSKKSWPLRISSTRPVVTRNTKDTNCGTTKGAMTKERAQCTCESRVASTSPANEWKLRIEFYKLINISFRARCIDQDAEEENKEKSSVSGANVAKQECSKWKKSRNISEEEQTKESTWDDYWNEKHVVQQALWRDKKRHVWRHTWNEKVVEENIEPPAGFQDWEQQKKNRRRKARWHNAQYALQTVRGRHGVA